MNSLESDSCPCRLTISRSHSNSGASLTLTRVMALLVQPVRGHAVLGQTVHLLCADLDFDPLALGPR